MYHCDDKRVQSGREENVISRVRTGRTVKNRQETTLVKLVMESVHILSNKTSYKTYPILSKLLVINISITN